MNSDELKNITKKFAKEIIKLGRNLPDNREGGLRKQVIDITCIQCF